MATVLVPWQSGSESDRHRLRALMWVLRRWGETPHFPRLSIGDPGPWCKAASFMHRVPDSEEVVVIADADCWCDGVGAAIAAVGAGRPWAVPHKEVRRLTETSTEYLIGGCVEPLALECDEDPYEGISGGGIVVVRRDVLLEVPFDPRFKGWGGEDTSWCDAMLTLIGSPWRGRDPLLHLYHPPQARRTRKVGSRESDLLRRRYVRANRRPKKMRALLAEIDWKERGLDPIPRHNPLPIRRQG